MKLMKPLILIATSLLHGFLYAAPARDHVLLVVIDDLNDWVSCLSEEETGRGHTQASTPHLDRLSVWIPKKQAGEPDLVLLTKRQ